MFTIRKKAPCEFPIIRRLLPPPLIWNLRFVQINIMANKKVITVSILFIVLLSMCGCNSEKHIYDNFDIDSYFAKKVRKSTYVKKEASNDVGMYVWTPMPKTKNKYITKHLTVNRIYKGNKLYEILLSDSLGKHYEVVSLSCRKCSGEGSEKIQEGKSYNFVLVPQYNIPEDSRGVEFTWIITFGEYQIRPAHLLNGEIYVTPNLCGLEYQNCLELKTVDTSSIQPPYKSQ